MTPYEYEGVLVRAIDGDTVVLHLEKSFTMDIDFGFYIKDAVTLVKSTEQTFRLFGINTPEVIGEQRTAGLAAKAALEQRLADRVGPIRVRSYKGDKYGRWLAVLYITDASGTTIDVNQWLIEQGHAKPYTGDGPKPI